MAERGRPSLYDPNTTPKMAGALANQGLTNEEIAKELGINVSTFYAWKAEYPDFSEKVQSGASSVDDRVENAFLKRALGYDLRLRKQVVVGGSLEDAEYDVHIAPEPGAALNWLKNRRPEKWRDKQPEGQGNERRLNIVLSNQSDMDMSNVELNLGEKKDG